MFIYITTNNINGKRYIGACTTGCPKYLGSGKLLREAIKKHGKENFSREIIEYSDDKEYLYERERYWISYYDAVNDPSFYNLSYGGKGGDSLLTKQYWDNLSSEEREKRLEPFVNAKKASGDKHISKIDPNWSKNLSKSIKKSWDRYTEEEKNARLETIRKYAKEKDQSGEKNPMFGRSAVKEKNLRWYTNGESTIYVTEGTQPEGFTKGRTFKRHTKKKGGKSRL
jgi:hypothetical protein